MAIVTSYSLHVVNYIAFYYYTLLYGACLLQMLFGVHLSLIRCYKTLSPLCVR